MAVSARPGVNTVEGGMSWLKTRSSASVSSGSAAIRRWISWMSSGGGPGAPMLAIELLFPADRATAELLKNLPTDPDELLALERELGGAQ